MKKTIIALLALTGVAGAVDYSGAFSGASTTNPTPTFTFEGELALTLSISEYTSGYNGSGTLNPGSLRPNVNVGGAIVNGVEQEGTPWSAKFTLKNDSAETITLGSITFDAYAFNSGGSAQSADKNKREINFTLTGDIQSSVVHSFTNETDPNDDTKTIEHWDDNPTLSFTPIEISTDDELTFTLKVSESDSKGCYVGLTGITFSTPTVPEPTTATLSLLALAGLAARRRRK
ncbi:MAG: PEP-CTERM sorting domain-containing protein [Akkermansia sp.]|nr:PEP-CTERM sorting domain-containing protein [Akkermansia sp.]